MGYIIGLPFHALFKIVLIKTKYLLEEKSTTPIASLLRISKQNHYSNIVPTLKNYSLNMYVKVCETIYQRVVHCDKCYQVEDYRQAYYMLCTVFGN